MVLKSTFNPLSSACNARRFYASRGDATKCDYLVNSQSISFRLVMIGDGATDMETCPPAVSLLN